MDPKKIEKEISRSRRGLGQRYDTENKNKQVMMVWICEDKK